LFDSAEVTINSRLIIRHCRQVARTRPYTTVRLLVRATDIAAPTFLAGPKSRPYRSRNPNVFYYVPIKRLFSRSCIDKVLEVHENTRGQRGVRVTPRNERVPRVGTLIPR
jgi:hypothetical protein